MDKTREEVTVSAFYSLMGRVEMECALAAMVNIAKAKGCFVADLWLSSSDFNDDGFDRDGFDELVDYGYLLMRRFGVYVPSTKLIQKLHSRMPNV